MSITTRFAVLAALLALPACNAPLQPGDLLVGTWSNDNATLVATDTGAVLALRCIRVRFPPLQIEDGFSFTAAGTVTDATGLVTVRVGDPWSTTGHVIGDRVVVRSDTLTRGDDRVHVCNA